MGQNSNNQKNRTRFIQGFVRSVFNREDPYLAAKVSAPIYLLIFLTEYLITGSVSAPPVFIASIAFTTTYIICYVNEQILLRQALEQIKYTQSNISKEMTLLRSVLKEEKLTPSTIPMSNLSRESKNKLQAWFESPIPDMQNRTPIQIIKDGDCQQLLTLIEDMQQGQHS